MADPAIVIAGKSWPVPFLAPRQNRIVVPPLLELRARPETQYEALLDITFAALTRAHSFVTREEFEDWPVATFELVDAVPIIARQTGLLRTGCGQGGARAALPDWDAIIAQFVNFLPGTTPDYWEDALTVPRLEAMREAWRNHPPLAVLMAGYLGYAPKPRNVDAVEELMRLFPGGQLRLN